MEHDTEEGPRKDATVREGPEGVISTPKKILWAYH